MIYDSLVYTDSKKTVSCLLPQLPASYHLWNFWKVILKNAKFVHIQGGLCLFHYVYDNKN